MLNRAWFLARMDLSILLRGKETIFWTFLMPIVFFFFIGSATGGFGGESSAGATAVKKDPLIVETAPDAGFLAHHLQQRLEEVGYRIIPATDADPESKFPRLAIPPAFTDSVLAGHPRVLTLTREKKGLSGEHDQIRVLRAAYTILGDIVAAGGEDSPPGPEGLAILSQAPRNVSLEVTRAGRRKEIPTGFQQAVPGTMVMFTLIVLLTSGSVLMVIERKEGVLRRLASTPLRRSTVLAGKWGGRMMLGGIQIGFAMIAGTVLFKVGWGPNLPVLLLVLLVYGALVAMLGIVLGNLARSEGQAVGIGVLAGNVFAALGGCWWPIEITPDWMQRLALFLPTGVAMDALHKLVSFEAPAASVVPHLAVMAAATMLVGWVATRTFRFQ